MPIAFDEAPKRVTATLHQEGFGISTDIDAQATMNAKLGVQIPKYRILGARNPSFAHRALQLDNRFGVLLPCNVIVREERPDLTEIAAIDPVSTMAGVGKPTLVKVAEEVRNSLQRAVDNL